MSEKATPAQVLDFWWQAGSQKWFVRDDAFDAAITDGFLQAYEDAAKGALDIWKSDAAGTLALIILLDQFPRNMFRDDPRAFATDAQARELAHHALSQGFDKAYPIDVRAFFYMPFMHSEDIDDQTLCVDLLRANGPQNNYHFALIHMDAIRRFGRFPHRNKVLGRETTAQEQAYLDNGGFSA